MKQNDSTTTPRRALRWTARVAALACLAFLALFMVGEGFNVMNFKPRDFALALFFPLGFMAGLILGWWFEFAGGLVTLLALLGFYLVHFALCGSFPRGWAFPVLAVPGALFLISACIHRLRPPLQPFNSSTL